MKQRENEIMMAARGIINGREEELRKKHNKEVADLKNDLQKMTAKRDYWKEAADLYRRAYEITLKAEDEE